MTTPLFGINELSGSTLSFNNLNTILRHYEQLGGLALSGLAAAETCFFTMARHG